MLTEDALEAGLTGDLPWFESHLLKARVLGMKFPLNVVRHSGVDGLTDPPQITTGTIHSVKGGEADVCYVFPDLSKSGMQEWLGNATQRAAVYRLFYVAQTRARESLILCAPASKYTVEL